MFCQPVKTGIARRACGRLTASGSACSLQRTSDPDGPAMTEEKTGLAELEESIKSLEALVEQLEGGELPLEQALAEFERGVKLTRQCQAALAQAEQRIEILLAADGEPEAFTEADDAEQAD